MPNWSKIISYIPLTFSSELLPYEQTHDAVVHKVALADYHYHILNQLYRPFDTPAVGNTPFWARVEMHSIIFNLYSALDSLAHETNIVYNIGIKQRDICVYHNHKQYTWAALDVNYER